MARHFGRASVLLAVALSFQTLRGVPPQGPQSSPANLEMFQGCGMEGDAKSPAMKALNRLKNHYTAPGAGKINSAVTLTAILAPGNDVGRWKVKYGAEIVGYVYSVKPGPVESVNCSAHHVADRDTHIELVLNPMDSSATRRVIVEITPRWRAIMAAKGVDWSTRALRDHYLGRWVRVRGWMLFDVEHKGEAENTAPGRPRNWRATAWEVHPVTAIAVVPRPR
jgi:hypothetical protein